MRVRSFAIALALLVAVFAAACGGTTKSGSAPTSPTAANATPLSPTTPTGGTPTAIIDLTTTTSIGTVGAGTTKPVVGVVRNVSGTCPNKTFVIAGVTVALSSATTYDAGNCEAIVAGVMAGAIGTRNAENSIVAARVKVGGTPPPPTPRPMPIMGTISALSGSCPTAAFSLGTVTVNTTASTKFEGVGCDKLANGMKAAVIGRKASDGSVTAEAVRVMVPPPPGTVRMMGEVGAVTGDCPGLTVTLKTPMMNAVVLQVVFTAATQISGGTCGDIKAGVHLAIEGVRKDGAVVEAQKVRIETAPPPIITFTGTIGNFTGTCPDTTFTVSIPNAMAPAMKVTTDVKTRYEGGTCQALGNDVKVAVAAIRNNATAGAMKAVGVKFVQ